MGNDSKRMGRMLIALLAVGLCAACGCRQERVYPSRPITFVCPWAAGGGTDQVSRQVAVHLEQELGQPVNVVNATGGKGVTGHSSGMLAAPDGYTLTMATLELSSMHWSGLTRLTYRDCEPLVSLNEDYAAILVRRDAPWKSLHELEAAILAEPGRYRASGTATGGAWHVALAGWLLHIGAAADDVIWISSTGASTSLQELSSGGIDLVCCALPEARERLAAGDVVALGVMAPERASGFEQVPTFLEQGTDWTLGGWRAVVVPLGTPEPIQQRLTDALLRVVRGETEVAGSTFPDFMRAAGFNNTWRTGDELRQFLAETDTKFGQLLTSDAMQSVNTDRFDRRAFPAVLAACLLVVAFAIVVQSMRDGPPVPVEGAAGRPNASGYARFVVVVASILGFVWAAPVAGFVVASGMMLILLFAVLRVPWWQNALLSGLLSVGVYYAFAHVLKVPLPRGWFDF